MSFRSFFTLSTLALLSAATACSSNSRDSSSGGAGAGDGGAGSVPYIPMASSKLGREPASQVPKAAVDAAVAANNAFAVDLYGRLRQGASGKNLLISPLSASLALSMATAGARGKTATEMASALHFGGSSSSIFEGQNALSQKLDERAGAAFSAAREMALGEGAAPSRSDYQLQVVNSVWGENAYKWKQPFLDILAKDYGSGVYLEDFLGAPEATRVAINDWVSAETAHKIPDLLPPGSLIDSRMVLVNAIHLRLPWLTPFDQVATRPAEFTKSDGSIVHPPFMHQTGTLPYLDDGEAQIVALPLAGQALSVLIALPHGSLADYEAALKQGSAALAQPDAYQSVALSVPKVSFNSGPFTLKSALMAMGMQSAFSDAADFSGETTTAPLQILDVLQETMIAMAENGVEAAAATAVIEGGDGGSAPGGPIAMDVSRPYLFAIVDAPTGAILFLGHIADPSQS